VADGASPVLLDNFPVHQFPHFGGCSELVIGVPDIHAGDGRRENRKELTVHVFHNSVHRYFVFSLRIALTSMKRLFNLTSVDG
jgi:hypothetical protein